MPESVSHYKLIERIGSGGMGSVWRARDLRNGNIVAVKLLHEHLSTDREYVQRFQREARIAQSIDSPNVVKVLDAGREGDRSFLVMEHVPGMTLAEVIRREGRLSIERAVSIAVDIAKALQAAHDRDVVHRDISPQNVIISTDGTVKVTDFGVARDLDSTAMTATSMMLGKPQYMAPEVATGRERADIRADIYSLGIVLYEMLTGAVPFNAETPFAVLQMQVSRQVPPLSRLRPDVPAWLNLVVNGCLAKQPARRLVSPTAVLQALTDGCAHLSARAQSRRSKQPPYLLLGGVAGGVVAVIAVGVALSFRGSEPPVPIATPRRESAMIPPNVTAVATRTTGTLTATPALFPPAPSSTPILSATATRTPVHETGVPNRTNCAEISLDAESRSSAERTWFFSNCVALRTIRGFAINESGGDQSPIPENLVLSGGSIESCNAYNLVGYFTFSWTIPTGQDVSSPGPIGQISFRIDWANGYTSKTYFSNPRPTASGFENWLWSVENPDPGLYYLVVLVDGSAVGSGHVTLVC